MMKNDKDFVEYLMVSENKDDFFSKHLPYKQKDDSKKNLDKSNLTSNSIISKRKELLENYSGYPT